MSKEVSQFTAMIGRAYRSVLNGKPMDKSEYRMKLLECLTCGRATLHKDIGDEGIYELYICGCGTIKKVAVR